MQDNETMRELAEHTDRAAEDVVISGTRRVTDDCVLKELRNCGISPESLEVMSIVPFVEVAWANGFVERNERIAILQTAEEFGITPSSKAYIVLINWLIKRPGPYLFATWRDLLEAVQTIVDPGAFSRFRESTLARARMIAESAGGKHEEGATSKSENNVIAQLNTAFERALGKDTSGSSTDLNVELSVIQSLVDRLVKQNVAPAEAYEIVSRRMKDVCYVDWLAIDFDESTCRVSIHELDE